MARGGPRWPEANPPASHPVLRLLARRRFRPKSLGTVIQFDKVQAKRPRSGVIPMSVQTPLSALVLFAHGSRDPKWAEPFKAIQALIRAQTPNLPVELAFLELMQPGIQECLSELATQGVKRISIVPIFLAAGRHLREDLPPLIAPIQKQFPDLLIKVTAPIGDIPEFQSAIATLALAQIT